MKAAKLDEALQYAAIARRVRRQLRGLRLPACEWLLAEWLLDLTIESGKLELTVDRLDFFVQLTGITRCEVSKSLRALERRRMIQVRPAERGVEYRLLPDANTWQDRPSVGLDQQAAVVAGLPGAHGQLPLLPYEPDLEDGIHQAAIEAAGCESSNASFPPGNVSARKRPFPPGNAWRKPQQNQGFPGADGNQPFPPGNAHGGLGGNEVQGLGFRVQGFKSPKTLSPENPEQLAVVSESQEVELLDRCRQLFGSAKMETYGGGWRMRIRRDPDLVERVLAEVSLMQREGRIRDDAGAAAYDLWRRWGGS